MSAPSPRRPPMARSRRNTSPALEAFHPERMASRILGMGDVVTLVERVQEQVSAEQAVELERKVRRAQFDLDDFLQQLRQIQNMGSLASLMQMVPGFRALSSRMSPDALDDGRLKRLEAIISSMTLWERRHPDQLTGSRRRRVAAGSGTTAADVNQLLGQFKQMQKVMKRLSSGKVRSLSGLGLPGV